MVVGGYQNGKVLSQVEIISKDPDNNCTAEIGQLPINAQGMVGGFTKRAAIVCGGETNDTEVKKECYEYIPKTNRYKSIWRTSESSPRSLWLHFMLHWSFWVYCFG